MYLLDACSSPRPLWTVVLSSAVPEIRLTCVPDRADNSVVVVFEWHFMGLTQAEPLWALHVFRTCGLYSVATRSEAVSSSASYLCDRVLHDAVETQTMPRSWHGVQLSAGMEELLKLDGEGELRCWR
jgi:hypothetical protein